MAMAQTVGSTGKNIQKALKFVARSFGIGILLWLFVMILASTLQIVIDMDFVPVEVSKFSHIACLEGESVWSCSIQWFLGNREAVWITTVVEVDVATFIVVGAIDLILQVLHTIALVIGMIIVWVINAFIIGEDSSGKQLNPISLFQIIKMLPILQDVFAGVRGIDESIITSLDLFLTAIDNLFYEIANGFFTGIAGVYENIARGILGKRSTG